MPGLFLSNLLIFLLRQICLKRFFLINSLAFLAASLALAAYSALVIIFFATSGFCSKNVVRPSVIKESQTPLISPFPNFVLVWPSNCGSGTLMEITHVNPSLTSSPPNDTVFPLIGLIRLFCVAYLFRDLVSAVLSPAKCVPPSIV